MNADNWNRPIMSAADKAIRHYSGLLPEEEEPLKNGIKDEKNMDKKQLWLYWTDCFSFYSCFIH